MKRRFLNHRLLNTFIAVLLAVVVTGLVIYVTPLKHFDLIAPSMHEVDPSVVYNEVNADPAGYMLIDVRDASIYNAAHAKGAINIPIAELVTEHYLLPRSGKQIVLVCTTGQLATIAYGYLQDWGFQNLLHMTGGFAQWTIEGLPDEGTAIINGVDTAPMVPDGASSS